MSEMAKRLRDRKAKAEMNSQSNVCARHCTYTRLPAKREPSLVVKEGLGPR